MSAGHSSAMQRWMQSGKPLLQMPLRFADDERVEMLIQSRHPTWSRRTTLAAKQAILQMAYYRAQEGTFRGEIPPEMDKNLEEVLQPAVQPAVSDDEAWGTWRASSDPRRPVTPPSPADPRRPVTPPRRPVTPPKQPRISFFKRLCLQSLRARKASTFEFRSVFFPTLGFSRSCGIHLCTPASFGSSSVGVDQILWASSASLSCEAPGSLLLGTTSMSEGDGIASGVDSDETQAPSTSSWLTAFPAAAESSREVGDGAPGPHPSMMDIGDLYVEVGRVKSSLGEECAALAFSLQTLRDELNDFKSVVTAFMAEVRGEIEELQVGFTRAAASANSRRPVLPAGARNRSRSA